MAIPLSEGEEVRGRIVGWQQAPDWSESESIYTVRAIHLGGGIILAEFTTDETQIPLGWRALIRHTRFPARELVVHVPDHGTYPALVRFEEDDRGGIARVYGDDPLDDYVRKMIEQRAELAGMTARFDRDVRGVWVASVDTGRGVLAVDLEPDGITLQHALRDLGLG